MAKREKNFEVKHYHIIILTILLCPILIINSNIALEKRNLEKLNQEANEKFERIVFGRRLESFDEGTKKICDSGSDELKEYYLTGDKSKIGLKDEEESKDDENPEYINALLDIVKGYTGGESENDIQDNAMTYGKHILGSIVFLVIAFLSLIGWAICCSCCCCNCCCCCCCKKPICRIPFFIITMACYALVIAISIYGLSQSNIIFVGLSDTECSVLKFFNETLKGESKSELPKWAGIDGIKQILTNIQTKIREMRGGTVSGLQTQKTAINTAKTEFQGKFKVNTQHVVNTNNYQKDLSTGNNYRLDITELNMYGQYDGTTAEPDNSYIELWHREYDRTAQEADRQMTTTEQEFTKVFEDNNFSSNLESASNTLDDIGAQFEDIKGSIADMIIDNSDTINDYGKLGFKIIFSVLAVIDAAIAVLVFLFCFFSGKLCNKCCCCRCFLKVLIHILWNVFALLMFFTFLFGSIFTIIGSLGKDFISVIDFFISPDNLNVEDKEPLLLGDEGKKLNKCFNGNGDILNELGINLNTADALEKLRVAKQKIVSARNKFNELSSGRHTYDALVDAIDDRINYNTLDFYAFKVDGTSSDSLHLSTLLNNLNNNKSPKYSFSCTADGCNVGTSGGSSCYSAKQCTLTTPFSSGDDNDIAKKIEVIKSLVNTAASTSDGVKKRTTDLKSLYSGFLEAEVNTLNFFEGTINNMDSVFQEYTGDNGGVFDFVNCKFLGTNVKVILKNLKDNLGNDFYTVGICLIISGCAIGISIIFTILLIVIINQNVDANKK